MKKEINPARYRIELRYKPYEMYSSDELRALKFRSVRDFDGAIDAIFNNSNLKKLPWDTPDGITMFVPQESVRYFRKHGLRFKESRLSN